MRSSPAASEIRLAIVADNASIQKGGEAAIPYHLFSLMNEAGVESYLVTHERNRVELRQAFPALRQQIVYVEDTGLHRALFAVSGWLPGRVAEATVLLASTLWTQSLSRRAVLLLIRERKINLIHQPTPVSPRAPSLLAAMGVPVVMGPMNGGMEYPAAMRSGENAATSSFVWIARRMSDLVHWVASGKRSARLLLVANERTRQALPSGIRGEVILLPENGVIEEEWMAESVVKRVANQFVFVGRLVDMKRLDIVLKAMKTLPEATLLVVGDGDHRGVWEELAGQLGLADRVRFLGSRSQRECARLMAESTALVLPSIYECGGAVVLEAMACALPVIAMQWGGPAEYLTPQCGVTIGPTGEDAMVQGFHDAMRLLAGDALLCRNMGENGRLRVREHYTWAVKIATLIDLYRGAVSASR